MGDQGRGMPRYAQIGRALALRCLSRRPRPPFARGDGDLPLPKPVKRATLAAKPWISGECRLRRLVPYHQGVPKKYNVEECVNTRWQVERSSTGRSHADNSAVEPDC